MSGAWRLAGPQLAPRPAQTELMRHRADQRAVAGFLRSRGVIERPVLYLAAVAREMDALRRRPGGVPEPEHDDMDLGLCPACDARRVLRDWGGDAG